jgi:hypothetical protein
LPNWVAHWKATRAAKADGQVVVEVVEDEPYVDEREKKLAAARAYNKLHYKPRPKRVRKKQC